ncbi:hypothetical protein KC331_g4470 [Hortaea werneckii]|uniref:Uncharacterized protein n=1 Tax=Hortaea werneckii TaxID=91943 RepID=A0A3M7CC42_HORWE|nr:hypothetical protein KC331_g4470 [Hortaea werneckii]RMY49742.1 hypothetical protein D0865_07317 [Hortaea werneckii]
MIFHILLASLAAVASAAYDGRLARRATCGARAASAIECMSSAVSSNTASVSSFCASSSYLRTVTRTITTRLPSTTTITTAATVGSITVAASTTSTTNTTTTLPSTTTAPSIAGTTFTSTITVTETTGTSTEIETSFVTSFTCATPAPSIRKRQTDAVQACAASYGENVLRNACNNCAGIAAATSFISRTVTPTRTRYSTTFTIETVTTTPTITSTATEYDTTITSGIVTTETTTTTTTVSSPSPTPTSFYLLRGSLPAEIVAEASYIDVVSAPSRSDTNVAIFVNGSTDATQFGLLDNGALVQLGRDSRASVNSRDLFNFLYFSDEGFTNAQIGSGSANAVTCSACDDVLTCVTDQGDQFAACPAAGGEYVVLGGGQAGCTEVTIAIDPVMTIF